MTTAQHAPRPSPAEWLCLLSGSVLSVQHAWLLDDAFVYFRYVDNLVHLDLGLVYNRGEFVEGYSSPLWVLLLIGLRGLGLGFWFAVRLVAVLAYAATWWALVRSNRLLAPAGARAWNLPLVLLTCNYAAACYFTSGTESPLVLLCGAAYALYILEPRTRWVRVVIALSPLVRHELALPLLAVLAWTWVRERRSAERTAPGTALGAALALGAWMLFRITYYADLFPNTFYLKDQADPEQGLRYLWDTAGPYHLPALLVLGTAAALLLRARGRADLRLAERGIMLVIAGLVVAYVVRIGGDARHFRYLAFPFALLLSAGGGLLEHALLEARRATLIGAVTTALLAAFTLTEHPDELDRSPLFGPVEAEMIHGIADAEHHRIHPALPRLDPWGSGAAIELRPAYAARLSGETAPRLHTKILLDSICWRIYADFERRAIQSLGLTEPYLARAAARVNRPAHKKLKPAGRAIRDVLKWWGRDPAPGVFRAAVEAGVAEPWIGDNLATLEVIEHKAYNRHDLLENLRLAFTFPPPVRGPEEVFGLAEPVQ